MGCCVETEMLPNYFEIFLEISHDAAQKKNLDVFIFPFLTNKHVLQNNCVKNM